MHVAKSSPSSLHGFSHYSEYTIPNPNKNTYAYLSSSWLGLLLVLCLCLSLALLGLACLWCPPTCQRDVAVKNLRIEGAFKEYWPRPLKMFQRMLLKTGGSMEDALGSSRALT